MKTETANRIAELRKAKGLTQAALADALGVHWVTVSKLERGKIQLHTGWMDAIAGVLGVEAIDLLTDRPLTREISIAGSLPGGGRYEDFQDENNDYEEFEIEIPERPLGHDLGVWVIVEGDGSWPFFHDQDKLYFIPVVTEETWGYLGRLCVVWTDKKNAFSGYLTAFSEERGADLQPINGKPMFGLSVYDLWILAEVRYAFPREPLSHVPQLHVTDDSRKG